MIFSFSLIIGSSSGRSLLYGLLMSEGADRERALTGLTENLEKEGGLYGKQNQRG